MKDLESRSLQDLQGVQLKVPPAGSLYMQDSCRLQVGGVGAQYRILSVSLAVQMGVSPTDILDPQDCRQTVVVRQLELNEGPYEDLQHCK